MGNLMLVLGGARSGKSTFAEERAREFGGGSVLYVATATITDDEMADRVERHRRSRPAGWRTLEAQGHAGQKIRAAAGDVRVVLLDCLSVLVANRMVEATGDYDDPFADPERDPLDPALEDAIQAEAEALIACARDLDLTLIVVSNEVGMGVVPPYELGRAYRDMLGRANQTLARHADDVYLLVAGIPMHVKGADA
jgi:adenosylcobinamide kinase/adenosylcobinamide-phosphate guanylyltransferase